MRPASKMVRRKQHTLREARRRHPAREGPTLPARRSKIKDAAMTMLLLIMMMTMVMILTLMTVMVFVMMAVRDEHHEAYAY